MTRPDLIAALLPCPFCGGTDVRIAKRDVTVAKRIDPACPPQSMITIAWPGACATTTVGHFRALASAGDGVKE